MTGKWVYDGFITWRNGTEFLRLEAYEECETHDPDKCECTEIWLGDDKTGNYDIERVFDTYNEAKKHALKIMRENPLGWFLKDNIKTEKDKKEKVRFT